MIRLSEEDLEKLKAITKKNGSAFIRDKAASEAQEYIDALDSNIPSNIIDETADVIVTAFEVMISQDIIEEVEARIKFKLDRTIEVLKIKI